MFSFEHWSTGTFLVDTLNKMWALKFAYYVTFNPYKARARNDTLMDSTEGYEGGHFSVRQLSVFSYIFNRTWIAACLKKTDTFPKMFHFLLLQKMFGLGFFMKSTLMVPRWQPNKEPLGSDERCGGRNLQLLCDSRKSAWTNIPVERFLHRAESMLWWLSLFSK